MLRFLASLSLVVFAIALAAMPSTAMLARAPDVSADSTDLQAISANVNFEISATPVAIAANPVATVLSASSAQTPTNAAIARSMPVISPTLAAAAVDNNIANYPNPFNATAKTITPATATTGIANSAVQAIVVTSADDNFGAAQRAGPNMAAALNAETGLDMALDTARGTAAGVATMRAAA